MVYIAYFICALSTGCLLWNVYHFKPMAGDRAVGQAWLFIMLLIFFILSTAILMIMMTRKGCFNWVSESDARRNLFVILFCIVYSVSVFFSGIFKTEWHEDGSFPMLLRYLSLAHVYLWIPLCVMIPFFFLIKSGADVGMDFIYIKYPLYAGILLSGFYSGLTLYGWMVDRMKTERIVEQAKQETEDRYHRENLETISRITPDQSINELLNYAYAGRPNDIHEAALNKIKERPDWENQVLSVLKDRQQYTEAFYFLSGNDVLDKEKFKDPLKQTIVFLSIDVGEFLKESNNFQDWILDHFKIHLMLEALDYHFKSECTHFSSEVMMLKKSIQSNTPPEAAKIKFSAIRAIDLWLKKNKIQ